jgi:branched-chain amino acid transport system ATP-binding protein
MDILRRTGLGPVAEKPSGGLSLLQRKRLELARAMATKPRVILLDEIAGGLTDAECVELVATIRAIHAEGTSIIWIEHVLHALTSVVERLMVLNFGRMLMIGQPDQVMASPEVKEIYLGIEA